MDTAGFVRGIAERVAAHIKVADVLMGHLYDLVERYPETAPMMRPVVEELNRTLVRLADGVDALVEEGGEE